MISELMETRAERGVPRGAHAVWRDAQAELVSADHGDGVASTTQWFRLAIVGLAAASVIGAMILTGTDRALIRTSDTDVGRGQLDDVDYPYPEPIVVDGMTLETAHVPGDSPLAEDHGVLVTSGPGGVVVSTGRADRTFTQVFAHPAEPFNHPILFVDALESGGFEPWGVNFGSEPVTSLTDQLARQDGRWVLPDESGFVEVANFDDGPEEMLLSGWQLDFRQDSETVTWQAEPHDGDGLWIWLGRISKHSGDNLTTPVVYETDVLGQSGLVVESIGGGDDVLWTDGDFVYRLTAGEIRGDTHHGRPAVDAIDRLRRTDQAEWEAMVIDRSLRPGFLFGGQILLVLAVVGVVVLSAGVWWWDRRRIR